MSPSPSVKLTCSVAESPVTDGVKLLNVILGMGLVLVFFSQDERITAKSKKKPVILIKRMWRCLLANICIIFEAL